jgi:hypothetical protein
MRQSMMSNELVAFSKRIVFRVMDRMTKFRIGKMGIGMRCSQVVASITFVFGSWFVVIYISIIIKVDTCIRILLPMVEEKKKHLRKENLLEGTF